VKPDLSKKKNFLDKRVEVYYTHVHCGNHYLEILMSKSFIDIHKFVNLSYHRLKNVNNKSYGEGSVKKDREGCLHK
jgi:hypothetical protein